MACACPIHGGPPRLALGGGEPGNELQTPVVIVILGGLLSSMALNMIVLPALYWLYGERTVAAEDAESDVAQLAVPTSPPRRILATETG